VPVVYQGREGEGAEGGQERGRGFWRGRNVITLEELIGDGLVREGVWKNEREGGVEE